MGSKADFSDGVNRTALREIKLQQELHHPNILALWDVFGYKSNISLVFDFMDTDLEMVIKDNKIVLTPANIKAYSLMTLQGLQYLHAHFILHRVIYLLLTQFHLYISVFFFSSLHRRLYISISLI